MKFKQPTVATQFQLEVRNRFQALADLEEDEDLERRWTKLKDALTKSAETALVHVQVPSTWKLEKMNKYFVK